MFFSPRFNFANWLWVDFSRGLNFTNLAKVRENRENLSRKQFISLRYLLQYGSTLVGIA